MCAVAVSAARIASEDQPSPDHCASGSAPPQSYVGSRLEGMAGACAHSTMRSWLVRGGSDKSKDNAAVAKPNASCVCLSDSWLATGCARMKPSSKVVAANPDGSGGGTTSLASSTLSVPPCHMRLWMGLTPPTLPTLCQGGVT